MKLILIILIVTTIDACSQGINDNSGTENHRISNRDIPLQKLIDSLKINKDLILIRVDKSEYKLSLYAGTQMIKEYPVVFGPDPVNDKLRGGDGCTPEGTFKVIAKYPHRSWSKFIWFDYPNDVSWTKHRKAKEEGKIPENAGIGGEVGIHGVPSGMDYMIEEKHNWTAGCVSLKNVDVNEIFPFIKVGMSLIISK